MKNSMFARFARAYFIFSHFEDVLVLSMTWNDLFCNCVDDVTCAYDDKCSILSCPKRRFKFNSRIVKVHFSGIMTLNNWKVIAETRSYIFRWRSCFRRRRVCLSSLLIPPWVRLHTVFSYSPMCDDALSRYWFRHWRISRITAIWRRPFHIFVNWFFFHNISTFVALLFLVISL